MIVGLDAEVLALLEHQSGPVSRNHLAYWIADCTPADDTLKRAVGRALVRLADDGKVVKDVTRATYDGSRLVDGWCTFDTEQRLISGRDRRAAGNSARAQERRHFASNPHDSDDDATLLWASIQELRDESDQLRRELDTARDDIADLRSEIARLESELDKFDG